MTKILFALTVALSFQIAHADLTAGEQESAKFQAETPKTADANSTPEGSDQKAEIADVDSEAGVCTIDCHPARMANTHTLQHISLNKIQ